MTSHQQLKALEDALRFKQKELDLLKAIDGIRDTLAEPAQMLAAIADLLNESFEAALCLICLMNRETDQVELNAINEYEPHLEPLKQYVNDHLTQSAWEQLTITLWKRSQLPPSSAYELPDELEVVVVPIIMGTHQRLGVLLIIRSQGQFTEEELQLLDSAEDQIDSAVIQGYVYNRDQQARAEVRLRQREIDIIDAIDRVRDTLQDPTAMLSAITNLVAERFEAELCLLFLLNRESGEIDLKAINEQSHQFGQLGEYISRHLGERATQLSNLSIWGKHEIFDGDAEDIPDQLQVAAVPIVMGKKERLGALLLARTNKPFGQGDIQLLNRAEDQIDSAIIQGYAAYRHQQSTKELETIYRIDLIRDQELPFKEMLDAVLQEVLNTIEAEMGFVMLYDRSGNQLEVRAASPKDLFQISPYYEFVNQAANDSLEQGELVHHHHEGESGYSLMCLPLILNQQIIGVLGTISRQRQHGFTVADRRLLQAIGSQVDTAIFEQREKRRLRQVLGRSVDPQVMQRLLANPDTDILKGERQELTVLYADIRGSTQLAERSDPEILVQFMNDYLGKMTEIILSREGTLDKFVGDEVMALFGAPFPQSDHPLRAVQVGLMMQATHQEIMDKWQKRGFKAAPIGIGIATGEMIVGEMGCAQRTDYTVIGRAANLGARICNIATEGQVLISQKTYDMVREQVNVVPLPNQKFKGLVNDVTVYHVTQLRI